MTRRLSIEEENAAAKQIVDQALRIYRETHQVPAEVEEEALRDFDAWARRAIRLGLRGIRINFNGCIVCPEPKTGRHCRVLLLAPSIILATDGRGFACDLCEEHEPLMRDENELYNTVIPAALRRIKKEPSKP